METKTPLTHLETRILKAIEQYIRAHGVSPTIAELATALRLKSKGTVHRYVQSLIEKEHLERHGHGWRGLRIVGLAMPDPLSHLRSVPVKHPVKPVADQSGGKNPEAGNKPGRTADFSRHCAPLRAAAPIGADGNVVDLKRLPAETTSGDFRIPLLGRIAAGLPIEAVEDQSYLDLAEFFIGPDRYALRVTGESMIDVGILDGDTVILRKQDTAHTGDIVVALIDAQEATLKRLGGVIDGMVELIPENTSMQTMRYAADRVSFQGVLVGQLRSY